MYALLVVTHHQEDVSGGADFLQLIFKSTNPFSSSSWSNPVHFDFPGYDTSPFWDTDGKVYVTGSHAYQVQYV